MRYLKRIVRSLARKSGQPDHQKSPVATKREREHLFRKMGASSDRRAQKITQLRDRLGFPQTGAKAGTSPSRRGATARKVLRRLKKAREDFENRRQGPTGSR